MMVGKNLNDNQLQQIVDKTILYLDKVKKTFLFENDEYKNLTFFVIQDEDGKINFEEFSQVIGERSSKTDIAELLTVDKAAIWQNQQTLTHFFPPLNQCILIAILLIKNKS